MCTRSKFKNIRVKMSLWSFGALVLVCMAKNWINWASADLFAPEQVGQVAEALQKGLKSHYTSATVTLDSEQYPAVVSKWTGGKIQRGCANVSLYQIGGGQNLFDPSRHGVAFDAEDILKITERKGKGFFFGPGAVDSRVVKTNAELIAFWETENAKVTHIRSKSAKITDVSSKSFQLVEYASTAFGGLAAFTHCQDKNETAIRIKVSGRITKLDFMSSLRQILLDAFPDKSMGIAGIFTMPSGTFNAHIMPEFSSANLTLAQFTDRLQFFEFEGEGAVFVGHGVTNDPNGGKFHLTPTHVHFWNTLSMNGGHYHYDVTPDQVEYEGYFFVTSKLFRIADPLAEFVA